MKRLCQNCHMPASFNFKGSKTATYCEKHAEEGMVDVCSKKRCMGDSCVKAPSYNFDGMKRGVYCKQHAEDGMVNVKSRRCLELSCRTQPSYNFEGFQPPAYCKEHAMDGMVDVKNKPCSYNSCSKIPSYNVKGITPAIYCKKHAEDGMVDVRSPRCSHSSCATQPNYGYVGRKEVYCKLHAEVGMVNIWAAPSSNDLSTAVGVPRRVSPVSAPTALAGPMRPLLDGQLASVGVRAVCGVAICPKQESGEMDGNRLAHCLDHAPLDNGCIERTATVGMACSRGQSCCPSSPDAKTHHDGNGDGGKPAAKRTRNRLYRRASPP